MGTYWSIAEWHIDPHKIGVLGFSAGGHLVAREVFARRRDQDNHAHRMVS